MSESLIGNPPTEPVDTMTADRRLSPPGYGWRNFFSAVWRLLSGLTQSGTTAQRPTTFLWVSRPYLDATLGIPIWWDGTQWIDATGAPA